SEFIWSDSCPRSRYQNSKCLDHEAISHCSKSIRHSIIRPTAIEQVVARNTSSPLRQQRPSVSWLDTINHLSNIILVSLDQDTTLIVDESRRSRRIYLLDPASIPVIRHCSSCSTRKNRRYQLILKIPRERCPTTTRNELKSFITVGV